MKFEKDIAYQKSNSIFDYPVEITEDAKKYFQHLRERENLSEGEMQIMCNKLSEIFAVPKVHVRYGGSEPHKYMGNKLREKTHGTYQRGTQLIRIYKYTAVKGKRRATKATLGTLIHEFVHHLDFYFNGLSKSLHTKGFYKRLNWLTAELMGY